MNAQPDASRSTSADTHAADAVEREEPRGVEPEPGRRTSRSERRRMDIQEEEIRETHQPGQVD